MKVPLIMLVFSCFCDRRNSLHDVVAYFEHFLYWGCSGSIEVSGPDRVPNSARVSKLPFSATV